MFEQCLYFNAMALARSVEKAWTGAFRRFDLTPAQAFCLRAVLAKSVCRPSELASTLGIARATATRALDQLARKGLIERETAVEDNRESLVRPTVEAKRIARAIEGASGGMTTKMKEILGDRAFEELVTRLKKARLALE